MKFELSYARPTGPDFNLINAYCLVEVIPYEQDQIIGSKTYLLPYYSCCIFASIKTIVIADTKLNIDNLQSFFQGKGIFGIKDILLFYQESEPDIKQTTVNWRVYNLVQTGIISRVSRGKFSMGYSKNFIPEIRPSIKTLYKRIHKQFPYLQICLWNTSVFNEFMLHQPGRFYTLIEVEKDALESVFYFLSEKYKNVFIDPSADTLTHYASRELETIIVKSLVTEAPVQKVDGVVTVTLEKMLVDIFSDDKIFTAQQGHEMQIIFTESINKYTIQESRILRYADRKRKKEAFSKYLEKQPNFRQQMQIAANL